MLSLLFPPHFQRGDHAYRKTRWIELFALIWLVWWKEAIIAIKIEARKKKTSTSLTFYNPFESLLPGLSISSCLRPLRPSRSVCQIPLLSHFFPPSSRQFLSFFPLLNLFNPPNRTSLQLPTHSKLKSWTFPSLLFSSYLSLTSCEDLEGLNLLLLSIPGNCLWVQDAGNHRVLLYLRRETKWDRIVNQKIN